MVRRKFGEMFLSPSDALTSDRDNLDMFLKHGYTNFNIREQCQAILPLLDNLWCRQPCHISEEQDCPDNYITLLTPFLAGGSFQYYDLSLYEMIQSLSPNYAHQPLSCRKLQLRRLSSEAIRFHRSRLTSRTTRSLSITPNRTRITNLDPTRPRPCSYKSILMSIFLP